MYSTEICLDRLQHSEDWRSINKLINYKYCVWFFQIIYRRKQIQHTEWLIHSYIPCSVKAGIFKSPFTNIMKNKYDLTANMKESTSSCTSSSVKLWGSERCMSSNKSMKAFRFSDFTCSDPSLRLFIISSFRSAIT